MGPRRTLEAGARRGARTSHRHGLQRPTHSRSAERVRLFAMEMSATSLGSSQTFRRPHLSTDAASRFCSLSDTMAAPACRTAEPVQKGRPPRGRAALGAARTTAQSLTSPRNGRGACLTHGDHECVMRRRRALQRPQRPLAGER